MSAVQLKYFDDRMDTQRPTEDALPSQARRTSKGRTRLKVIIATSLVCDMLLLVAIMSLDPEHRTPWSLAQITASRFVSAHFEATTREPVYAEVESLYVVRDAPSRRGMAPRMRVTHSRTGVGDTVDLGTVDIPHVLRAGQARGRR